MQIEIKIDENCKEPKIIVMTDKMTDEVNAIIKVCDAGNPMLFPGCGWLGGWVGGMVEVMGLEEGRGGGGGRKER